MILPRCLCSCFLSMIGVTEVGKCNGLRKRERISIFNIVSNKIDIVYGATDYNVIYFSILAAKRRGGVRGMLVMEHRSY